MYGPPPGDSKPDNFYGGLMWLTGEDVSGGPDTRRARPAWRRAPRDAVRLARSGVQQGDVRMAASELPEPVTRKAISGALATPVSPLLIFVNLF